MTDQTPYIPPHGSPGMTRGSYARVVILLTLPFYLNDFANIFVADWRWWLFIDYAGLKLFPVLLVLWLIKTQKMTAGELGLQGQPWPAFTSVFLGAALMGTLIDQNAYALISGLPGYSPLGGMPAITSPLWDWIDLTVGLFMVGVCEELVFRGFMLSFLRQYTERSWFIILISAAAFGLIHWSLGLHVVLVTALIGGIFMGIYIKTRSLPPLMLAHFAINFIDFAGVIPKTLFKLV